MIVYRELSSLEQDLGFSVKTLYAVSNNLARHYHQVQIPKKSGGTRTLTVPDTLLKLIQRRIADVLLFHVPVSPYARAYVCGSSTKRNAQPHVAQKVVLNLDIYHFFDSIRYSTVKDIVFPSVVYAEPLRILLAMLCYHGEGLPQGAPTSPIITNIIMREFDETVGQWCAERGIVYTRYCDDMTFSGDFDPKSVIVFLRSELKKRGFLLNEQKTRIQLDGRQQSVTGLVVNERLNVPSSYRRKLRQELYFIQKFGLESHLEKRSLSTSPKQYLHQLLGKVNYVLQITPDDPFFLDNKEWLIRCIKSL